MRRGEVWTAAAGSGYAGKPRTVVVVQDDRFDATDSVTVCAFTTDPTRAPLFRLVVEVSEQNGLNEPSSLMIDKLTTVRRASSASVSAASLMEIWSVSIEPLLSSSDWLAEKPY